jgi:hypothetical protein
MVIDLILWDDEDDLRGNSRHILSSGLTREDVEHVLHNHDGEIQLSESTGRPIIFGSTPTGEHIAVVFTFEDDPELIIIAPVTAFPVPKRGDERHAR